MCNVQYCAVVEVQIEDTTLEIQVENGSISRSRDIVS